MRKPSRSKNATKSKKASDFAALMAQSLDGLTPRQTLALQALLEGKTRQAAAAAAGVHRNRISKWLNGDDHFRLAYLDGIKLAAEQRILTIHTRFNSALDTIFELMQSDDVDAGMRLKAATYIIDKGLEGDERIAHVPPDGAALAAAIEQIETAQTSILDERIEFRQELAAAYDRSPEGKELNRVLRDPNLGPYREGLLNQLYRRKELALDEVPLSGRSTYRSAVAAYNYQMRTTPAHQPSIREQKAAEEREQERVENVSMANELKEKLRLRREAESRPTTNTSSEAKNPDHPG